MKDQDYIYRSERLGFRQWYDDDIDWFAALCADQQVMQYFPKTLNREESKILLERLISLYDEHGYTYYVAELSKTQTPIGFIGIAYQNYLDDLPAWCDIGWRLHPDHQGNGLATEGAKATLRYAVNTLKIREVLAVAPVVNKPSIHVMEKIGMTKIKTFIHPKLRDCPQIETCVLYGIGL